LGISWFLHDDLLGAASYILSGMEKEKARNPPRVFAIQLHKRIDIHPNIAGA